MSAEIPTRVGRYLLHHELASGGMGTVYLATSTGQAGFRRFVAVKRMHRHLARDPEFVEMFLDEARVASELRHPAVVPVIDVVEDHGELLLVMDYVEGVSLDRVLDAARECQEPFPHDVAVRIFLDALAGTHSAHETRDAAGQLLGIVHRDLSPHNLLVGVDGSTRILDFGIAHAEGKMHQTRAGVVRGKASYMAPEQLSGYVLDARADVYSLGITLWEVLVGRRAFSRNSDAEIAVLALTTRPLAPHEAKPEIPRALSDVVLRAIEKEREERWPDAHAFAEALERALPPASPREVARFLKLIAADVLDERQRLVRSVATQSQSDGATTSASSNSGTSTKSSSDGAPSTSSSSTSLTTDSAVSRSITATEARPKRVGLVLAATLLAGAALIVAFILTKRSSPAPPLERESTAARPPEARTTPSPPANPTPAPPTKPAPSAASSTTAKPISAKPASIRPSEAKPAEAKPPPQPTQTKPTETKPTEAPQEKPSTVDDLLGRH